MTNIYQKLGIPTIINASGSMTVLGGSIMLPEVAQAMAEASQNYVHLPTLKKTLENRVAEMLSVAAVHFCSGASAGITLSAAACMTGSDITRVKTLPKTESFPNIFLTPESHKNKFDHAIQVAGGQLKTFSTDRNAFKKLLADKNAVAIYYTLSWFCKGEYIPISEAAELAKEQNIPIIVDAAAQVPPIENFQRFLEMGANLVVFSGGKTIKGPQVSGLILGDADLIEACDLNNSPNIESIGRGMKLSKEEIVALYVALKYYLENNHEEDQKIWLEQLEHIKHELAPLRWVQTAIKYPYGPGYQVPYLEIRWKHNEKGKKASQLLEQLRNATQPIYARFQYEKNDWSSIVIYAHSLKKEEEIIIAENLLAQFVDNT